MASRLKLIRIVTVPMSFRFLLWGQLKWMKAHFDLIAVSSPDPDLEIVRSENDIPTVGIPMTRKISPFSDLVSLVRMIYLFLKERPDIVHTHTPKAGLIGMVAAFITRVPVRIHTVAGMPLMSAGPAKRRLLRMIEWLTYACSTVTLPNSKGLYTYIRDTLHIRLPQVQFLEPGSSSGIDLDYFDRTPAVMEIASILKASAAFSGDFVFVFAGRLVKDKGIEELAQAFQRLNADYPQTRLVVVGGFDSGLNPISAETRQVLETHSHIHLAGHTSDVRPFLAASSALVLPSYREGLPQIVLQGCAMGLPCIVTRIMGCEDLITEGENGFLIPVKSSESLYAAMKKMIENKHLYAAMQANARPSIQRFRCDSVWEGILHVYQTELHRRKGTL